MADIKIQHEHDLGLAQARVLAKEWMADGAAKWGLHCTRQEGEDQDVIRFERMGATGEMTVRGDSFAMEVHLGAMLGAFKPMVEAEIERNLQEILAKAQGRTPPV